MYWGSLIISWSKVVIVLSKSEIFTTFLLLSYLLFTLFFSCRCKEGYRGLRCDQFVPKTDPILSNPSMCKHACFFPLLSFFLRGNCFARRLWLELMPHYQARIHSMAFIQLYKCLCQWWHNDLHPPPKKAVKILIMFNSLSSFFFSSFRFFIHLEMLLFCKILGSAFQKSNMLKRS